MPMDRLLRMIPLRLRHALFLSSSMLEAIRQVVKGSWLDEDESSYSILMLQQVELMNAIGFGLHKIHDKNILKHFECLDELSYFVFSIPQHSHSLFSHLSPRWIVQDETTRAMLKQVGCADVETRDHHHHNNH
eukprot:scaffold414_cov109-Cylindrotheca_fusiformis.AAC.6